MRRTILIAAVWLVTTCMGTQFTIADDGFHAVACEGTYPHHLQGVCTDDANALYWSFTTQLGKTDREGKVQTQVPVGRSEERRVGKECRV